MSKRACIPFAPVTQLAATFLLLLAPLVGCGSNSSSGTETGSARAAGDVSPAVLQWQHNMLVFGSRHCSRETIQTQQTWEGGVWYYDGARAFYQIADYSGDRRWEECARYVIEMYRSYVLENQGQVPGWRVFPHGLLEHYRRTGDERSRDAVLLLAQGSAFAASSGGPDSALSRETAYIINAYLAAQELGAPGLELPLETAVSYALGHIRAWIDGTAASAKPFMIGLTLEALINLHGRTGDPRVPDAVRSALNWLWDTGHLAAGHTFPFILCREGVRSEECRTLQDSPAPDLNLLIAPAFAWLHFVSGDEESAVRGDRVFEGGVFGADLSAGKRFTQNYRWSFDYLRWRAGITSFVQQPGAAANVQLARPSMSGR
ncbi:glycoside hydrolase family 88 protein [Tautonia sociabilis]|uniref:Uncharacterized protein n=1 Tax=Tautonia sociabilis TaxID=2080755 RepID=A0A432ML03_9BACT|nr:hypothetical protein [Tautonia sociabilis]RUL87939.1 hypothetical protein TsocGM_09420 [Tautonia sociabilis]